MYRFDCMIFNPAGGCGWKCESENLDDLIESVLNHLDGGKILVKEHRYLDTAELRKNIKAAIIKKVRKSNEGKIN